MAGYETDRSAEFRDAWKEFFDSLRQPVRKRANALNAKEVRKRSDKVMDTLTGDEALATVEAAVVPVENRSTGSLALAAIRAEMEYVVTRVQDPEVLGLASVVCGSIEDLAKYAAEDIPDWLTGFVTLFRGIVDLLEAAA